MASVDRSDRLLAIINRIHLANATGGGIADGGMDDDINITTARRPGRETCGSRRRCIRILDRVEGARVEGVVALCALVRLGRTPNIDVCDCHDIVASVVELDKELGVRASAGGDGEGAHVGALGDVVLASADVEDAVHATVLQVVQGWGGEPAPAVAALSAEGVEGGVVIRDIAEGGAEAAGLGGDWGAGHAGGGDAGGG